MSTTDIKLSKSEKNNLTMVMASKYAGAWKDDRTSDEIVSEVYSSRSSKSIIEFSI